MAFSTFFLLLILYSFAGWILEVAYCWYKEKRLINRGFLYGPLCPIYGAGCMLISLALAPLGNSVVLVFLAATALLTALEYATSWGLEKIFSTTWWDYSTARFNLNGRVCLVNSLAFGFMGVFLVRFAHPFLVSQLSRIPSAVRNVAAISIFVIALVDFILTLTELLSLDEKIGELKTFTTAHVLKTEDSAWFDARDLRNSYVRLQGLSGPDSPEAYADRLTNLEKLLQRSAGMQRVFKSFPGMRNRKHDFSLDRFRPSTAEFSLSDG